MSYVSEVTADAPSTWYRFGEASGTAAVDAGSLAHNGTYVNTPTLAVAGATGDGDTAVTFASASTEHVTLSAANTGTTLRPGTGAFTLEVWLKRSGNPGAAEWIFDHGDGNAAGYGIRLNTSGKVQATIGATTLLTVRTDMADGAWHHIVFSCPRSGSFTVYVDGASDNTVAANATDLTGGGQDPHYWGRRAAGNYLNGSLDDFALYKGTALSGARILAHYDAAVGTPPAATNKMAMVV